MTKEGAWCKRQDARKWRGTGRETYGLETGGGCCVPVLEGLPFTPSLPQPHSLPLLPSSSLPPPPSSLPLLPSPYPSRRLPVLEGLLDVKGHAQLDPWGAEVGVRVEPPEREGADDGVVKHDVAAGDEDEVAARAARPGVFGTDLEEGLAGAGLNGGVELGETVMTRTGMGKEALTAERRASLKAD